MEDRKRQEKNFHDKIRTVTGNVHVADTRWSPGLEETIRTDPNWRNMKYYAIERKSRSWIVTWFKKNCTEKRILDYCCGNGEDGIVLAKSGAREVIGIDISDTSIENCIKQAKREEVDHIARYEVRDAEETGFPDDSFDIITEYGALHHLDLDKAFSEMARILKPDGKIICNEALGHNPVIHWYRKHTPELRTQWEVEHIMRRPHFQLAERYFGTIQLRFYHLFALGAVPFRKMPFFSPLLKVLELIDEIALRCPVIKWQAWQVVFILSNPKKPRSAQCGA